MAAHEGQVDRLRLLVEGKADVNLADEVVSARHRIQTSSVCQDGDTPLIEAIRGGHVDCVRFLVEAKVDVNAQDEVRVRPRLSVLAFSFLVGFPSFGRLWL